METSTRRHSRPETSTSKHSSEALAQSKRSTPATGSRPLSAGSHSKVAATSGAGTRSSGGHSRRRSTPGAVSLHSGRGESHSEIRPVSSNRDEEEEMASGEGLGLVGSRPTTAELRAQDIRRDLQLCVIVVLCACGLRVLNVSSSKR